MAIYELKREQRKLFSSEKSLFNQKNFLKSEIFLFTFFDILHLKSLFWLNRKYANKTDHKKKM